MKRIVLTLAAAALVVAPVTAFGNGRLDRDGPEHRRRRRRQPPVHHPGGLVKKAGLAGALSGTGKLTVFAPTNAAFAKVPKSTLAALATDKAKLRAVLTYHVVRGAVPASTVLTLNGKSVKTLNGAAVKVRITGGAKTSVYVNNAKVVKADVPASNGVIHVINAVLPAVGLTGAHPRGGRARWGVTGRTGGGIVGGQMRPWPTPDAAARRRERRLAAGLRRSDPAALREVYEDYGAATFGFLRGALGDRAAAEDVQQEVFLEVWRRGGRYDPARGSLGTWIMAIARSRAIDALRRRVPEPRDPAGAVALAEQVEDPAASADELLERWRVAAPLRRVRPRSRGCCACASTTGSASARSPSAPACRSARSRCAWCRGSSGCAT